MDGRTLTFGVLAALALCASARASEVEVKLVDEGADGPMAFEPSFVKIKPGDSVKFVPANEMHNAESIEGMAPDGAQPFQGELGKPVTQEFDKAGVYGVLCSPHFMMGMVGLIAVGDSYPNLDAAKKAETNPEAKKRLDADFAKLGK